MELGCRLPNNINLFENVKKLENTENIHIFNRF